MIEAEFTDTNVPAKLTVTGSAGGIAGLTVNLKVLDANTQTDTLDFNDNNFKAAGHTTPTVAVTDVGGGRYSVNNGLDVSAMNIPVGTKKLILQYDITGAKSGIADEELLLRASTVQVKVGFFDDGLTDRYTVVFFKNSEPFTVGVVTPKIQVIKRSDGTDLIAEIALTQVASLGLFKHDETTNLIQNGKGFYAKITATIEGKLKTWYQHVGRDA